MLTFNRRVIFVTAALALAALVPGLLINRITWVPLGPALAKSAIYFFIILFFVCLRPVAVFLKNLPKPHAMIAAALFIMLLFAQTVDRSASTFPFISWPMYSEIPKVEHIEYYAFYAVDENGQEERIYPAKMFPSLSRLIIFPTLKWLRIIQKAQEAPKDMGETEEDAEKTGLKKMAVPVRVYFTEWPKINKEKATTHLNGVLTAIGLRYRALYPEKEITMIRVYRGRIRPEMQAKPELDKIPAWETPVPRP